MDTFESYLRTQLDVGRVNGAPDGELKLLEALIMEYMRQRSSGQLKPLCYIKNDRFSYVMTVDDTTISFTGLSVAEYFYHHYKALGYKLVCQGFTIPGEESYKE